MGKEGIDGSLIDGARYMIEILQQSSEICLAMYFSDEVTGLEIQQFTNALGKRLKTGD